LLDVFACVAVKHPSKCGTGISSRCGSTTW